MTSRRAYRSDLSDARWALIEPVLSAWRAERADAGLGLSEPGHDLREIVNAIFYVNRTGIAWEYLPHDFPPYKTVYDYYAKWEKDGTTQAIHDLLRGKAREQAGRAAEPTAAIIDAQAGKASSNGAEASQGYDAGKRTKGRYLEPSIPSASCWPWSSPPPRCRTPTAARTPSPSWPPGTRPSPQAGRRLQEGLPGARGSHGHYIRGRPEARRPEGVRGPAAQMGCGAHLRVACPAPQACPRLRDPPVTFRDDDLLGADRQHEPQAHRRNHPNLAGHPR